MTSASVSAHMPACRELLASCLWNMTELQRFWDPISETEVLYDDGKHQEATMSVRRNGQLECIRIVRFRSPASIEFFNPVPPPMMRHQRGSWEFHVGSNPNETLVVARRDYQLTRDDDESDAGYAARCAQFNERLVARLTALLDGLRAFVCGLPSPSYVDPEPAPCASST